MLFFASFFLYCGIFPLLDDILVLADGYFHAKAFEHPRENPVWHIVYFFHCLVS